MASISSVGIGSGVLTSELIDDLVAVEREAGDARLDSQEELLTAQISALGTVSSLADTLRSSAQALSLGSSFESYVASSSDEAVLTATASSVANAGSYTLEVDTLAAAQTVASGLYTGIDSVVGQGTLQFSFGDVDYDADADTFAFDADLTRATQSVVINSTNNTLSGIRDAVNKADIGIRASIVDTGSGFRLLFESEETGEDNGFKLAVANPSSGLDALRFDSGTTSMLETVAASNANFTVNGLDISRETNTVVGVINGVTLNLKQTTSGPVSLTLATDTDAITEKMQAFVDAYNELKLSVNELTAYDPDAEVGSLFTGDSTIRTLISTSQRIMGTFISQLEGGDFRALSEVGIKTNYQTGELEFTPSEFQAALASNPAGLTTLFGTTGDSSDSLVSYTSSTINSVAGDYAINITQAASQGSVTGAVTSGEPFTIDGDNDAFTFTVDGTTSGALTLTSGSYTGEELATLLQNTINADSAISAASKSVTVAYNATDKTFAFTSDTYGSTSSAGFSSVDTTMTATLGVSTGLDYGTNVEGTIGGYAATGTGQSLVGAAGTPVDGLRISVTGSATGDRGTVTLTRGIAEQLESFLDDFLDDDGTMGLRQTGLNNDLTEIGEERAALDERIEAFQTRLAKQFAFNDALVSQLNSTQSFLEQQFEILSAMYTTK